MTSPVHLESPTDSKNKAAVLFHSYSRHLTAKHGGKTYKIVVASGLSCPVRCGFCDIRGSSSFHGKSGRGKDVADQLAARLPKIRERFGATRFLAYFQSHTNTYAPTDQLEELYTAALSAPDIDGLCIGTRPDCLPEPTLQLLNRLAFRKPITLELGIQSLDDATLEFLGRGHSAE
ncbi:MAG: radical SAM protein, partial [Bdellovibrionota bacterium]